MSIRKLSVSAAGCLIAALVLPAPASADPVTVTGGYLEVIGNIGSMELTGERGFSLSARVDTFTASVDFADCGHPGFCAEGQTISLGATWAGGDVFDGVLTFEGETYQVRESGASVAVEFEGGFTAPPISSTAVVTAPFTLVPNIFGTGGVSGFSLPHPGPSFALQGSGIATINLSQYFETSPEGQTFFNTWNVDSVRYDFSPAEPVPEPGTMLLAGLGIAGIARRVARRRG